MVKGSKMKSEVEVFWDAICPYFGLQVDWYKLSPDLQMQVIQGINQIIYVMNVCHRNKGG